MSDRGGESSEKGPSKFHGTRAASVTLTSWRKEYTVESGSDIKRSGKRLTEAEVPSQMSWAR